MIVRTRPFRAWLVVGLAALLLGACGKRGPLYLPEKVAPATHAAPATAAAASTNSAAPVSPSP